MDSEVNKNIKSFNESKTDKAYESSGLPETIGGRIRMFMNDPGEYRKRHKKYVQDFEGNRKQNLVNVEKIEEKYGQEALNIQKNSSSATIDKNIKKETNISPPNTKGKGNTTIIGGGGQQQSVGGGGGGTTGSSAPSFSSQDPNNLGTFSTQGMYNMVG